MFCHSPATTTATSAPRASSTACRNSASSSNRGGSEGLFPPNMSNSEGNSRCTTRTPRACSTRTPAPARARMPASTVTVSARSKSKAQGPRVSRLESASGPMTAIELRPAASSGSRSPSLRSSTADRSAAIRATSRWAGSASTARAWSSSTYGASSRPSRIFAASTRRTLASTAAGLAAPESSAPGRCA